MSINYWFDGFSKLKSFQVLSYEEVVSLYDKVSMQLEKNKYHSEGDNKEPINSDKQKIYPDKEWNGYSPRSFLVPSAGVKCTAVKSDVVSMDMKGLGDTWDSFIYLIIPKHFFDNHQVAVHSNPRIELFRKYMNDVDNSDMSDASIEFIINKYDDLYPIKIGYEEFYNKSSMPSWRLDFDPLQYVSVKKNGILFPICYNDYTDIMLRGTHRTLTFSAAGNDVPIFVQYPKDKDILNDGWFVNLYGVFDKPNIRMKIDVENKVLEFYSKNKLFERYD